MQILYHIGQDKIAVTTPTEWTSPGEFLIPDCAVIDIDCPEGFQPLKVNSIGEHQPKITANGIGKIYPNADVSFEITPEEVI